MGITPKVLLAASLVLTAIVPKGARAESPRKVTAPLVCSRGKATQAFNAVVTMPATGSEGSTFTVRIDSVPSGKLSHFGLNYIWDMTTDYVIPPGASYVEGSARIVPETGTLNARTGANIVRNGNRLRVVLPARIQNGSVYTPPSVEFALHIDAHGGTPLAVTFAHYEVSANVLLLGNLTTTCEPSPKPYPIGMTFVDARAMNP